MGSMTRWIPAVLSAAAALGVAAPAHAAGMAGNDGAFTLTARASTAASGYAPTFTGNGLLGVRVPPAGEGYAPGTVPAQSELAGFYAKPSRGTASERVQQRANLPTWSTLALSIDGTTFAPGDGRVSDYRQSLDLKTGIVTTRARFTAPQGRVVQVSWQVLTDRAREHVGLVRLTVRPRFTGTIAVTDAIDGTADTTVPTGTPVLTRGVAKSWNLAARTDQLTVRTLGTRIDATLADALAVSANVTAPSIAVDAGKAQSVGQRLSVPVSAGRTYTFTKYVGVEDSEQSTASATTAAQQAASASLAGWGALLRANRSAWAAMWRGRIDLTGDPTLATDVNASEFYLWSSTRSDEDWSVSPAGLSSNGYDGHIFWDAETWMFPSLLAQHPALADAMERYRFARLAAARALARQTGSKGARFPWESALDGTEQIPPPVRLNSEGLYELHITADIALAQWQYYLATGDRAWLSRRGWPVISGAAAFWASRASRNPAGGYWYTHVTGPDEENPDVSGEVYTQVAARETLLHAIAAARLTGHRAPAAWARVAAGLRVRVVDGVIPEFHGYRDQLVKQADVTLLPYPWGFAPSAAVERADLNFYVPRTDPGGPSMDDAVSSIDSSALSPGTCQAFVYTERSYQPFIRDVFHQFSETRTGGAFTFMTGIGGFLQEFLYGYSGMRLHSGAVALAPRLSGPITSMTLRDLRWHGRTFTLAVHRSRATVTLDHGAPLPLGTPGGRRTARVGRPVTIAIRPVTASGGAAADVLRCRAAQATSAAPGAPALAAVDGSPATDWQPAALPATLGVPVRAGVPVTEITLRWGRMWPAVVTPNVHPAPGPVHTVRSTDYVVQGSADGRAWRTLARVRTRSARLLDTLRIAPTRLRYLRVKLVGGSGVKTVATATTPATPVLPMLQELTAR